METVYSLRYIPWTSTHWKLVHGLPCMEGCIFPYQVPPNWELLGMSYEANVNVEMYISSNIQN